MHTQGSPSPPRESCYSRGGVGTGPRVKRSDPCVERGEPKGTGGRGGGGGTGGGIGGYGGGGKGEWIGLIGLDWSFALFGRAIPGSHATQPTWLVTPGDPKSVSDDQHPPTSQGPSGGAPHTHHLLVDFRRGPKPVPHSPCSKHCYRQGATHTQGGRIFDRDAFSPCTQHKWKEDFRLGHIVTLFTP